MRIKSLKFRIQATTVAVLLLPLLVMSLITSVYFYQTLSHASNESNNAKIEYLSNSIENRISRAEQQLTAFAAEIPFRENGPFISTQFVQHLMRYILDTNESINTIRIVDNKGLVRAIEPFQEEQLLTDLSGAVFVQKALQQEVVSWSRSHLSIESETPVSSMAIPFEKGALVATFDIAKLANVATPYLDETVKVAIVDRGGIFLTHSDPEKYQQRQWEPLAGQIRQMLKDDPTLSHYSIPGPKSTVMGNLISQTGLMVILYQDRSAYLDKVRNLTLFLVAGATIFLLAGFISALRTSDYFFSYIRNLSSNIHGIAKGEYATDIPTQNFRELIDVRNDFTNMVEQIQDREYKIQALNHDLEEKLWDAKNAIRLKEAAELELEESHKTLLTVLDGLESTIYVADLETYEVLFMNRQMKALYGEGLVGSACFTAKKGRDSICDDCPNEMLLDESGEPTEGYTWEQTDEITGRTSINHDRIIQWVDGRMVKIQIATDVTEITELEDKLRQSQKMEAIGTLAGGIAHDFNNILSAIIGYAEIALLNFGSSNQKLKHDLDQILSASNRARELVQQILQFSRKDDRSLKATHLAPLISDTMKLLRSTIPSTIDIQVDLDKTVSAMVNPIEFHQIIMNLCTNAYHAMKGSGGTINLRLEFPGFTRTPENSDILEEDTPYCALSVSDNGHGISPRVLSRIFEPYYTSKDKGEGTGLGLAVVHGLVKSFGGEIAVASVIDSGTTFTVYLPALQTSSFTKTEVSDSDHLLKGSERVVIVDDDQTLITLFDELLSSMGYSVTPFIDPTEAIEYIREHNQAVDLVFTDMTMPQLTGLELFKEIQSFSPEIPVILCTGYSDLIEKEQALSIGIKDFLQKPIHQDELAASLRKVLQEQAH